MSIATRKNNLINAKQIEKEYFTPWEKILKESQADLRKRQRNLEVRCNRDINLLKTCKAKLRKFNYQLSICEVLGLDRIDRIHDHLHRKIIQYNEYCKEHTATCEKDKKDMTLILEEHAILSQNYSRFYQEKKVLIKYKYSKV